MAAVETVPPPPRARRRTRLGLALDAVIVLGVVAVVAFPVAARIAASRLPEGAPPALAPLPAGLPHPALRDVPVGLRPGDLSSAATAVLGARRARALLAVVRKGTSGNRVPGRYPYSYPALDRILPRRFAPAQVAAATDLGAKLIVRDAYGSGWAAPAAYAVLDRARAGGACDPAIDLLLLVEADTYTTGRIVAREAARAGAACPGDPAPEWLLGQYQSQVAPATTRQDPESADATFARLVRALPGAAAAWAGQADLLVRHALVTPADRPWVIRHLYERALARYRRAARLSPGPEADMGVARALAGLGRYREAARVEASAAARLKGAPLPLAQLVVYREGAHRWTAVAAAADALIRLGPARPAAFYPAVPDDDDYAPEPAFGPISLGARARALSVHLRPETAGGGAPASLGDLTFLPVSRPDNDAVTDRWFPRFSLARALLLAGRPAAALARIPAGGFAPLAGHDASTSPDAAELRSVARLEAGTSRHVRSDVAQGERQNLWRWAGDYGRAERAARQWVGAHDDFLARQRLGEIEFLRRRYDDAAADFATAARRARARDATRDEAQALLERGAALLRAGRRAEGEDALRAADDEISRGPGAEPGAIAYYAREQLGDAAREAGALPAAAEAYGAAGELVPALTRSGEEPIHPEVLENNWAIVDDKLGRTATALAFTRRALRVDPENPALLMTAAYAADRAGRRDDAIRFERRALAADATAYPAANDLGVMLAGEGRDAEAVAALRRAVGGDGDYALGWFNLGVVLGGMGPLHLLSSQGALARAFALDPALRDRERTPTPDEKTYRTRLDVSRPLPPKWTFAGSQRHAPAKTAGLVALLAAAFGLSRALQARGGRKLAEQWLGQVDRASSKARWPAALGRPVVAVAATLAVLLWPLARDPGGGATAAAAGALGLVLLVGVALRGRAAMLRDEPQRQRTWAPGVVFGLGAAVAGLLWTPLPVLGEKASPRTHWAAPAALAVVAVPLVLATVWLDVPLTRSLAAAALVMAASLLTPIKPVDGGAIAAAGGTAAGLAGIALAAVLALGLV
jgi:cellulose synthase operon protein C